MNITDVPHIRLWQQQLSRQTLNTPVEVVTWFGAMQAQEYADAKWALGLRLPGSAETLMEQAFNAGEILRTHVMRPTWHFVTPADIRWILDLTAPRVRAVLAHYDRKLELDAAIYTRSNDALARALAGGKQLTRTELAGKLKQIGVTAAGQRLSFLMMRAELDAVICSGGRRGKQFTYALLSERAPQARTLPCDEALAELTRRFFTSHGPALIADFAWWSGLTQADTKAGLAMVSDEIVSETINGKTYYYPQSVSFTPVPLGTVYLLPPFDEYGIAYKDRSAILDAAYAQAARTALYGGSMVKDGQVIGYWQRTLGKNTVFVTLAPFRPLSADEHEAFAAAALPYGAFWGLTVEVSVR